MAIVFTSYIVISVICFLCQIMCICINENKCLKFCCKGFGCGACCYDTDQNDSQQNIERPDNQSQKPIEPQQKQENGSIFNCGCFGSNKDSNC